MVTPTSMSMPMSPYDAHKNFAILLGLNASRNGELWRQLSDTYKCYKAAR